MTKVIQIGSRSLFLPLIEGFVGHLWRPHDEGEYRIQIFQIQTCRLCSKTIEMRPFVCLGTPLLARMSGLIYHPLKHPLGVHRPADCGFAPENSDYWLCADGHDASVVRLIARRAPYPVAESAEGFGE